MKTGIASNDNEDDSTGYGKPPKEFQFKKGQSGNPKGRPKKRKTREELFEAVWQTEVTINGKKMTKAEAYVLSLVNDGIKGKASARNLLTPLLPVGGDDLEDFEPSWDDRIEWMKTARRYETRPTEEEP